jgi:hypothetical protein
MATKMADDQQQRYHKPPPGAIALVKSLVQQHRHDRHHLQQEDNKPRKRSDDDDEADHHEDDDGSKNAKEKKGNARRCGGCYQIVVETTTTTRAAEQQQEEEDPRGWVVAEEAFAAAFQAHAGCQVLHIQTLPSRSNRSTTSTNRPITASAALDKRGDQQQKEEEAENPVAARTNYSRCETWKEELLNGIIQEFDTSTGTTTKTTTTTNDLSTLVVKVLDSVIPILYHHGGHHSYNDRWKETLSILRRLRQSCHVLVIHVDVGNNATAALSRRQIQSIEATASAVVHDHVLLRRGVHEYDQWLREDLRQRVVGIVGVDNDDDETKPPALSHNKNGGGGGNDQKNSSSTTGGGKAVFDSPRNDPNVVQFHQAGRSSVDYGDDDDDDEEDPDDDLDI